MSEWLPIESAPKDGSRVLVYGQWAGETNGLQDGKDVYVAEFSGRSDYHDFWWSCVGTDGYAAWVKPTHWMPLPAPPK